jgi:transcriptional regulator with XRE-family HTH domain
VGISSARTVEEWEAAIGRQVRDLRLRTNRTQADLARESNVSVSALHALEHGAGSSLTTLVSVTRALGRTDWLDALAPPAPVSPMAMLAATKAAAATRRQRARPTPGQAAR